MKKRSIVICVLLSLATFGLFGLYWMFVMNREINEAVNKQNATKGVIVILFGLLTCGVYTYYWFYKMGENVDIIKTRAGIPSSNNSLIFLILGTLRLGIVSLCLMQDTLNKHVA